MPSLRKNLSFIIDGDLYSYGKKQGKEVRKVVKERVILRFKKPLAAHDTLSDVIDKIGRLDLDLVPT